MNTRRLLALILILGLLAPTAGAAALAGPCTPGAIYDPACDVDHDGDVDIFDIQLTASRWNRTGTWVSDNDHNHLGQTWTGNNNPLVIQGTFGLPGVAPLVLTNSGAGDGLWITGAGKSGVFIGPTGNDGVYVNRAGSPRTTNTSFFISGLEVAGAQDMGVQVGYAGLAGIRVVSSDGEGLLAGQIAGNGVRVDAAGVDGVRVMTSDNHGLHVMDAGWDGLRIGSAGETGVHVGAAGGHGLRIEDAAGFGIVINNAGGHGLYIDNTELVPIYIESRADGSTGLEIKGALGWSASFEASIWVGANCVNCRQALFAVNSGDHTLKPGAIVAVRGPANSDLLGDTMDLFEVSLAEPGDPVLGIVSGRARLDEAPPDSGPRVKLQPDEGDAAPGDYLSVIYNGPVKVKVASSIEVGQKLTVAEDGSLRPLRTARVDGMEVAENAPVLGIALESTKPGQDTIWVLVNPQ